MRRVFFPCVFSGAGAKTAPWAAGVLLLSYFALIPEPAFADLKVCNQTKSLINVAIGYKSSSDWTSEGWWRVGPGKCKKVLKGDLNGRFYYIHAIDSDKGGAWSGKAFLCTRDKLFTIKSVGNCIKRGFLRTGFFEVDTGNESDWTVNLTGSENKKATSK